MKFNEFSSQYGSSPLIANYLRIQFSKSIEEIIVGYSKTSKGFNPLRDLRSSAEQPVEYRVLDLFDDAAEIDRVRLSSKLRLKVDVGGAVRMVSHCCQ